MVEKTERRKTMSAPEVYQRVVRLLKAHIDPRVDESSLSRLSLYVTGLLHAHNGSPARVAKALHQMQLTDATAESLERQIRRTENDPEIQAEYCLAPLARQRLLLGKPVALVLIVDPTLQEDRIVMVSMNVWYRGRSLPIAWSLWPANRPLEGARFWERVAELLQRVAAIVPKNIPITCVADRAFGTPAFTDLIDALGWNWVVRVQSGTLCQDHQGRVRQVGDLVRLRGQRAKMRGQAFKKAGWRTASVVVLWGRRHLKPLCVVSNLPPDWALLNLYRQRFPIEGTFRDYKAYGWRWEQGQVTDLKHMERLLIGMAIGTWIALMMGSWQASQILAKPATGNRYTRPWDGKMSLFQLGLDLCDQGFLGSLAPFTWLLTDWLAPCWSIQITAHHVYAFVFA
jgi:hypothetical protein